MSACTRCVLKRTHCTSTKCVGAIPHKVDDNPFDRLLVAADDAVLVPDGMLQLQYTAGERCSGR
jgi:hypothetical protein